MKRKSKFFAVVLSCCPGLGHVYLGCGNRGGVFFLALLFDLFVTILLGPVLDIFRAPIPLILAPLIWLAALVDCVILTDKVNNRVGNDQYGEEGNVKTMSTNDRKLFALMFSLIPGAGHMYLGMMNKGVQLMIAFFASMYLTDFLRTSLFLLFAPVIWFYSIFDVLRKLSEEGVDQNENLPFLKEIREKGLQKNHTKMLGVGLIAVGVIALLQRIVGPMVEDIVEYIGYEGYHITEYVRTGVVALLFILGGIRLVLGDKEKEGEEE